MPATLSINHCPDCGFQIPVRLPREEEQSHSWECTNCGAVTAGVFDDTARQSILTHVARRETLRATGRYPEVMRLLDLIEIRLLSGRDGNPSTDLAKENLPAILPESRCG